MDLDCLHLFFIHKVSKNCLLSANITRGYWHPPDGSAAKNSMVKAKQYAREHNLPEPPEKD